MGLFSGILGAVGSIFGGSGESSNTSNWGLGPVGNTFANTALGIYANRKQFSDQVRLMEIQSRLNREEYGMRHQLEVDDLRKAGLNPILSANSAGSIAGVSGASAGDMSSSIDRASSSTQRSQQNELYKAQMAELASRVGLNSASSQAQVMNAETQRMQTLGNLSLQKTQALVNNALKGWYVTQATNLSRYPSNNGRIERELRGVGRIIGDSTESLLRSLGANSAGSLDSTYRVHVPGTNRSYQGLGVD